MTRKIPKVLSNSLFLPIPPCECFELDNGLVIKTHTNHFCRIASDDTVGRHITSHHRVCSDDSTISNMYSGHNRSLISNPNIISHNSISLVGKVGHRRNDTLPSLSKNSKRVRRKSRHLMIGAIHQKSDSFRKGTEFSNDEFVSTKWIVVQNIFLKKSFSPFGVVIIAIVSDFDIFPVRKVFQKYHLGKSTQRMKSIRVWSVHTKSMKK